MIRIRLPGLVNFANPTELKTFEPYRRHWPSARQQANYIICFERTRLILSNKLTWANSRNLNSFAANQSIWWSGALIALLPFEPAKTFLSNQKFIIKLWTRTQFRLHVSWEPLDVWMSLICPLRVDIKIKRAVLFVQCATFKHSLSRRHFGRSCWSLLLGASKASVRTQKLRL